MWQEFGRGAIFFLEQSRNIGLNALGMWLSALEASLHVWMEIAQQDSISLRQFRFVLATGSDLVSRFGGRNRMDCRLAGGHRMRRENVVIR